MRMHPYLKAAKTMQSLPQKDLGKVFYTSPVLPSIIFFKRYTVPAACAAWA